MRIVVFAPSYEKFREFCRLHFPYLDPNAYHRHLVWAGLDVEDLDKIQSMGRGALYFDQGMTGRAKAFADAMIMRKIAFL